MPAPNYKNVVVLGGSYGGVRAAQIIAEGLPADYRVIVVDRNSHVNHLYVFPRYAVLGGHEYKAFIPYTHIFYPKEPTKPSSPHLAIQATVTNIGRNAIKLSRPVPEHGFPEGEIPFEYAVYALGGILPAPIDVWAPEPEVDVKLFSTDGTKMRGIEWLKRSQQRIKKVESVLVVGGGALGVQFATDIAEIHPTKNVTLLHSRGQLLPRFDIKMHEEIIKTLEKLEVNVLLNERLDLSTAEPGKEQRNPQGERVVKTVSGREIAADLILLCTGQRPNTDLLAGLEPSVVDSKTHLAKVLRTMQVGIPPEEPAVAGDQVVEALQSLALDTDANGPLDPVGESPLPHIFAIGDAADAFGAIAAGHTAYYQGEVAARNILKLIEHEKGDRSDPPVLERYKPGLPAIKVSLGLRHSALQVDGKVWTKDDGHDDLEAPAAWPLFGAVCGEDEYL